MTAIDLRNNPCDCPPNQCADFVEPDSDCINRLTGEVRTLGCWVCMGTTWHQDGRCLRCKPHSSR